MVVQASWKDQASCRGADLDLFFSVNKVDQRYAVYIYCNSCPVRQECFDDADREDFKNSVRAGYLIGEYKGGPRRPPFVNRPKSILTPEQIKERNRVNEASKSRTQSSRDWSHKLGTECKAGHTFTKENMDSWGRCKACNAINNRRWRAKMRGC